MKYCVYVQSDASLLQPDKFPGEYRLETPNPLTEQGAKKLIEGAPDQKKRIIVPLSEVRSASSGNPKYIINK